MGKRRRKKAKAFNPARVVQPGEIKRSRVEGACGNLDVSFGRADGVPPVFQIESFFESLRSSVWLMACSYRLAYAIASVGFKVVKRSDRTEAKGRNATQIRDLFEKVNEEDTYFDWIESKMIHLAIAGESFTEIARNRLGEPNELFEWNPDSVYPIPDSTGRYRVAKYRFTPMGGCAVDLGREDVIHTKVYNPFARHRGFSFVSAMKTDLSADIQAAIWNRSFMSNGARPSGWLKPTHGDLDSEQWRRLVSEVERTTAGSNNAGKYGVLPTGIDISETGTSPKDLDWGNLRRWAREVAAGGTGIPPILIGNFDAASYANTEQQLRAFWDYVGKPWLRKIFAALNEQLVHPFIDDRLSIWPDMLEIDGLIDSESTRVDNSVKMLTGGIMTINEARQRQGLVALPDGDRLLVPLSSEPVSGDDLERKPDPEPSPPPPEESEEEAPPEEENVELSKASAREREAMREAHARQLKQAERKIASAAERFLRELRQRFVDRARASGDVIDPDTIAGPLEVEARFAFEKLAPILGQVIQDGGDVTLSRFGMEKSVEVYRRKADAPEGIPSLIDVLGAFDEANPRVLAHLEMVFRHLEDLTRETINEVRGTITKGLADGLGINEIVLRLEELSVFSEERAERIARTETAAAQNLGASEAFRLAGVDRKSWLSAKTERTRDSHRDADARYSRNPIPVDEKFVLFEADRRPARAELKFPGDPDAPAWAVVNCLCAMVPEEPQRRLYWVEQCRKELAKCPT